MKILQATYDKDKNNGVFVLSQVKSPAMQSVNVLLAEEKEKPLQVVLAEDNDQMIIYCVAMAPDKYIWRSAESLKSDEGGYITFSSEVIELAAHDFLTLGKLDGGSLDHSETTDQIKVIESWVVIDASNDKAIALGMQDIKGGEWIIGQQVLDVELWEQFKKGDYTGISIEGMFGMVEVKAKEEKMTFENISDKVLNQFLINN